MDLYQQTSTFDLPNANAEFDNLPNGRLLATDGTEAWLETAVGSGVFKHAGTFPSPTLAGFVRVSPGGQRAAMTSSDGKRIEIFDPLTITIERYFESDTSFAYDSEWIDDSVLAVTLADTMGAGRILKFYNADNGDEKVVVRNLGDASGGVTFDPVSRLLYAGIGYLSTPDPKIGLIKAFPESQWSNPPANGIDFEASGTAVANFLSAAFLGFDKFGNLYVGGGDAFGGTGDKGYVAVVHKRAVDDALLGGPVTDPTSSPTKWQRFDPDAAVDDSWFVNANQATGDLYLKLPDSKTVYRFRPTPHGAGTGVLWRGLYQLGDNAFYYPGTVYAGLTTEFPVLVTVESAGGKAATFTIQAREVQTLAGNGHPVTISAIQQNQGWKEVPLGTGYLKSLPGRPITACSVTVDLAAFGTGPYFVLFRIRIDTTLAPGLYDDVILTELSFESETLDAKLGFA